MNNTLIFPITTRCFRELVWPLLSNELKANAKKMCLESFFKDEPEGADFTDSGRPFHTTGPEKVKARSQNVLSLGRDNSKCSLEKSVEV